jgi:D-alanyl-D-alanine endopeptidase (penicillin-binding protein 7)
VNIKLRYLVAAVAAVLGCACTAAAVRISKHAEAGSSFFLLSYERPILRTDPGFFDYILGKKSSSSLASNNEESQITAKSYLVGNVLTGKIYIKSNDNSPLPVASMSKLVTAVAATDMLSPDATIEITNKNLSVPPDGTNLYENEKFTLSELLYPMLVASSNVAAEAIASTMADRDTFTEGMVSYAKEIGMSKSFFADPSGINPQNVASAQGIFALAKYLYKSRPDILAITRTGEQMMASTSLHAAHEVVSTHPFIYDRRFLGGKTGRTPEAGETMLTILNINDQPIAFIVLGSHIGTREWDTRQLIERYEKMVN